MILANLWTEFTSLFAHMHWIVVILLCLGVVFCLVEAVIPGFGVFGILGIVSEVAGIVVHAVFSGSVAQVFFLILLIVLITSLMFLLFIRSAKHGVLAKSAIVENKPSIPTDYAEKEKKELSALIGKDGLTLTDCRPVGKIRIGQETYEAQSKSFLAKGEVVKVIAIEDARIIIDKITY